MAAPNDESPPPRVVVSDRSDGLGERLRGLLSAIAFARVLGVDHRFTWSGLLADSPHHSIVAPEVMFDAAYLERHLISAIDRGDYADVSRRPGSTQALTGLARGRRGWLVHQDVHRFLPTDVDAPRGAFRSIFERIGWSPAIRAAIDDALSVELPARSAAVHLRAGDIVYGRYRFSDAYTRKVVSVPIGRKLVGDLASRNDRVVVFNQDRDVDPLLQSVAPNVLMASSLADRYASAVESAMFEIVLMARCASITAGTSGFARIAGEIAEIELKQASRAYRGARQIAALSSALFGGDALDMPRLQQAFAAYALFDVAAACHRPDTAVEALQFAIARDDRNPFYRLRLATYFWEQGEPERTEAALSSLMDDFDFGSPPEPGAWPTIRILLDRSPRGDYRLSRDHAVLQAAAASGQVPSAEVVSARIEAEKAARAEAN